jgi:hypothetical protein
MVLGTIILEAGPHERWPKALKAKLAQGGPSGWSPFGSDGSHDVQEDEPHERWPKTLKGRIRK